MKLCVEDIYFIDGKLRKTSFELSIQFSFFTRRLRKIRDIRMITKNITRKITDYFR